MLSSACFIQKDRIKDAFAKRLAFIHDPTTFHAGMARRGINPQIRYQDGMNLYPYVRSNPLRYTDPTGRWAWDNDWISHGVGGLPGFHGTEPMKAGAVGGGKGAAAWTDGVVPFADPLANQANLYDPCDDMF